MKAVIHHGGAGTTAEGIRAGIPSVIVPFGGDQPYWGTRIYELGIGPKPISRKKLNVQNLSDAILQATENEKIINNAKFLGKKVRLEDGVGNAVNVIEKVMLSLKRSPNFKSN